MLVLICKICGKEFKSYPSRVSAGKGKTCSRVCQATRQTLSAAERNKSEINRFFNFIEWIPFHSCWEWTGCKSSRGYGELKTSTGKTEIASRVSWKIHFGDIPDGMFVCHSCDNPGCVNPSHLFLGSRRDNILDMVAKDRQTGKRIFLRGNGKTISGWARYARINVHTFYYRIKRGWSVDRAINEPIHIEKRPKSK